MKYNNKCPFISIVVIGMNEEENLDDCFTAIEKVDYPKEKLETIYVDTGSTDNSVTIAKKYTDKVFVEESEWPTPGLARNRGLIESKYEIVHFIDGDIQIDKDYLKKAVEKLKDNNIHAVCGYFEEKSEYGFNKIMAGRRKDKTHIREGLSNATRGGATYKKGALLSVNGYDERIRQGQETELGERFRRSGYNVWFLNIKMGIHNFGLHNVFDFLKLRYLNGISMSYNVLVGGGDQFFKNNTIDSWKSVIINLVYLLLLIFSIHAFVIIILLHLVYIYVKLRFFKKIKDKEYFYYIFFLHITRPIVLCGQLKLILKYIFLSKTKKQAFVKEKMDLSKMIKQGL